MIGDTEMKMQESILAAATKAGQEHLVEHYKSIKDEKLAANLLRQLAHVDFEQVKQLYHDVYIKSKQDKGEQPVEFKPLQEVVDRKQILHNQKQYDELGFASIARGEAAVCIMSGGQGTRLGFDHPKGMFNIQLESGYTLFQYFAKKLLRLNQLVKTKYPDSKFGTTNMVKWYIMTSEMNHQEIVSYFKANDYFGYDSDSIYFFAQGGIPAVDYNGKILIESEGNLSLAPGGNGAIYGEMKNKGALEHMNKNGVKYIYVAPVDNVLLKLADPTCLGYLIKNNFEIASTYVKKASPEEQIGMHVNFNGRIRVKQYSEMPKQLTELRDEHGELVYCHGNRAVLYITVDFIQRITHNQQTVRRINQKYHLAEKKVKFYDPKTGKSQKPGVNNGVKFELFYFDAFEEAERFGLFETLREEEFAPLKNAEGACSPQSTRALLRAHHLKWVKDAGIQVEGQGYVQVDPRVSYNGEGIRQVVDKKYGGKLTLPIWIH